MTLLENSWDGHVHLPQDLPSSTPASSLAGHLVKGSPASNLILCMSINDTSSSKFVDTIISLNEMGRKARGSIVLDPADMVPARLRLLQSQGIRSVRIHVMKVVKDYGADIQNIERILTDTAKILHEEGLKWVIECQFSLSTWSKLSDLIRQLHDRYRSVLISDHIFCAGPDPDMADFDKCLELVTKGAVYVKITGLEKYSPGKPEKMRPVIEKVLRCKEGNMAVWGSDWPHVDAEGKAGIVDLEDELKLLHGICSISVSDSIVRTASSSIELDMESDVNLSDLLRTSRVDDLIKRLKGPFADVKSTHIPPIGGKDIKSYRIKIARTEGGEKSIVTYQKGDTQWEESIWSTKQDRHNWDEWSRRTSWLDMDTIGCIFLDAIFRDTDDTHGDNQTAVRYWTQSGDQAGQRNTCTDRGKEQKSTVGRWELTVLPKPNQIELSQSLSNDTLTRNRWSSEELSAWINNLLHSSNASFARLRQYSNAQPSSVTATDSRMSMLPTIVSTAA